MRTRYRVCAILHAEQKNLETWNGFKFIPDPNSIQVG